MMAAGGEESPSTINRLVWGLMMVFLTIALSLAGGMSVLQSFTILVGLPTAVLCAVTMLGMLLELEREFPILTESESEESERSTTAAAAQPRSNTSSRTRRLPTTDYSSIRSTRPASLFVLTATMRTSFSIIESRSLDLRRLSTW
jgi:choline-glycine betaine transporter